MNFLFSITLTFSPVIIFLLGHYLSKRRAIKLAKENTIGIFGCRVPRAQGSNEKMVLAAYDRMNYCVSAYNKVCKHELDMNAEVVFFRAKKPFGWDGNSRTSLRPVNVSSSKVEHFIMSNYQGSITNKSIGYPYHVNPKL